MLALALPLAVAAQTKPTSPQQVTEVTEDLDPATGKVIRRTTRTTTLPAGSTAPNPAGTASADAPVTAASDATVSDYFREKTVVSSLPAPALLDAYARFIDKVRTDRRGWKPADWQLAASVLSSLNARYNQVRDAYSLDDKLTIRSQQGEFQALRTARQISTEVSNKL